MGIESRCLYPCRSYSFLYTPSIVECLQFRKCRQPVICCLKAALGSGKLKSDVEYFHSLVDQDDIAEPLGTTITAQ